MITEDYVSFEVAKLLKEKGFDGQCLSKYNSNGCIWDNIRYDGMLLGNNDIFPNECLAPTLQMAMKWLRVNQGIHIGILVTYQHIPRKYEVHIMKIEEINDIVLCPIKDFDTYKEACEAAIKYCLENLI